MWRIEHKCNPGQPSTNYSMMLSTTDDGKPLTRVMCPTCKEEFFILGDDVFKEVKLTQATVKPDSHLPPGFVIPQIRKGA